MNLLKTSKYILASLMLLIFHQSVQAAVSPEQWLKLNQSIVNSHILPRYENLATQSQQLQESVSQLCKSPDKRQLKNVQAQFKQTLAAWQGIQHVTFGPIEILMRSYSIQFWPDKKNLTSKQLNKILSAEDPSSLTAESFQTASIAVKGLPAMERILFTDNALEQIKQKPFRCEFLYAISQYVQTQATNTHSEWQTFRQEFDYLESEEGLYASAQEATTDLMKAQVEPLEVIKDLKLLRPLGKAKAKAKRLENWRSGHALQNLQINIQTLHQMYSGVSGNNLYQLLKAQGATDLAETIEQQFSAVQLILQKLPVPLSQHIHDVKVREQLQQAARDLDLLHSHLEKSMTLLELQLGFNSRDGD